MSYLATIAFISQVAGAQTYKVYEPSSAATDVPTLVFLHGGAWIGGDLSQYEPGARAFKSKGVRVVLANYRLAPKFKHPAPIDDLAVIMRKLPASYSQIFLSGHSAGAHLIAFWNSTHTDPRVRGFIGLEGIYDIPVLPWLLIHSEKDELVDFAQTSGFQKQLVAQKIPVEVLTLKNESHFGAVESLSRIDSPAFQKTLSFIQKSL